MNFAPARSHSISMFLFAASMYICCVDGSNANWQLPETVTFTLQTGWGQGSVDVPPPPIMRGGDPAQPARTKTRHASRIFFVMLFSLRSDVERAQPGCNITPNANAAEPAGADAPPAPPCRGG